RSLELGEHRVDHVVFLYRLEVELPIVSLLRRVAKGGIEDLLLDSGVDLQLALDLGEQLAAFRRRPLAALRELSEQRSHLLVICLQERNRVLLRWLLPGPGHEGFS